MQTNETETTTQKATELNHLDSALREAKKKPEAPLTQKQAQQMVDVLFDGRPINGGSLHLVSLLAKTCHAINGDNELKQTLKKSPHGEPLVALLPTITKWAQGYVDTLPQMAQEAEDAAA